MTNNNDPSVILLPYLLSVLQNNGTVSLLNFVKLLPEAFTYIINNLAGSQLQLQLQIPTS